MAKSVVFVLLKRGSEFYYARELNNITVMKKELNVA